MRTVWISVLAGLRSYKTTILGICLLLQAVGGAGVKLLDDDPLTQVEWEVLVTAVALIFARDADQTSERALR